jgi:hypothetical protein
MCRASESATSRARTAAKGVARGRGFAAATPPPCARHSPARFGQVADERVWSDTERQGKTPAIRRFAVYSGSSPLGALKASEVLAERVARSATPCSSELSGVLPCPVSLLLVNERVADRVELPQRGAFVGVSVASSGLMAEKQRA